MTSSLLPILAIVVPVIVSILAAAFVLKGDLSALRQQLTDHIKVSERADLDTSTEIAALRSDVSAIKETQAVNGQRIASLERKVHG